MLLKMPQNVRFIIDTLNENGFSAYMVGGCVRDLLLHNDPHDYDVCTSATPEDVIRLFDKTVNTGVKHGTVTVIIDKQPVEVTTFRTEGEYGDFRHPDKVVYVRDLESDLSRRDFTVNAMCYNDKEGLIDIFGGEKDLKAKVLRAVGDPDTRFKEDALRILRLFRFCSALGFKAEEKTLAAAKQNAYLLKNISAERISAELSRIARGSDPAAVLPLLDCEGLPFLRKNGDIKKIPGLPDNEKLKYFAFLNLLCEDLPGALDFLKCSNAFKKYALGLRRAFEFKCENRADIKRLLAILGEDVFDMFCYKSAISGEDTADKAATARDIINRNEPYKISQLALNGNDIAALGYGGKEINEILKRLLETVIEDPAQNRKETLIKMI
ncbi:MAG: CCA tRNA nucleotidyltransferase [Clostridia bacterium]|nr:CCA tRNA nucleotidyltransferase [Clostridia bacterium]